MSARPLVSIVTPCLNPGERLVRCLDSVAAQTYPHIEHLVVDGGSTDDTVEILRERGVAFVSEPDLGQSHAINKGFARARGEWLGWLNADDALTPRAVEFAAAAIEVTPGVGWVYGDCEVRRDGERYLLARPPARVDLRTFCDGNRIVQPGSLVARWALEHVGPLDEELHLAMDYDLWLRLVSAGVPSVYVNETLAIFELHENSKTGSIHTSEFDLEVGASLFKRGYATNAAVVLGRAAATAARRDAQRVERDLLEREIARMLERARRFAPGADVRTVRAAAYAEAAERDFFASPRRFQYLLCSDPWRVRRTRHRLLVILARAALRRLTKRIPRPLSRA